MSSKLETSATLLMAVAAIAVAGKYLMGDSPESRRSARSNAITISEDPRWKLAERVALPVRVHDGAISVIEFIDVECPYCRTYSRTIDSLKYILGDSIQIRYVNMPISGHRFAEGGAVAIECAFREGIGMEFVSTNYRWQDSIGFWSWGRMASSSGLADTVAFHVCLGDSVARKAVKRSTEATVALEINATPTIMVNSWRYSNPPKLERLLRDIRMIASGGSPK